VVKHAYYHPPYGYSQGYVSRIRPQLSRRIVAHLIEAEIIAPSILPSVENHPLAIRGLKEIPCDSLYDSGVVGLTRKAVNEGRIEVFAEVCGYIAGGQKGQKGVAFLIILAEMDNLGRTVLLHINGLDEGIGEGQDTRGRPNRVRATTLKVQSGVDSPMKHLQKRESLWIAPNRIQEELIGVIGGTLVAERLPVVAPDGGEGVEGLLRREVGAEQCREVVGRPTSQRLRFASPPPWRCASPAWAAGLPI
jgi:hypothetical protein